ncbi:DUF4139 domain-containing protein [Inhella gelatinilytica]|uniref:Mucoidy inhibitor MuiA family protein n=1 Tax=Inhella gelatinilytica TaxID=2795030 RepID=A0A931IVD2_9BURK|nr:DUF4139 domain-containing protein [Inhella gelatinilytica]MBH9551685.1 mucoidy inhibitor MuiA family protein [Inhella gelatinilytica]
MPRSHTPIRTVLGVLALSGAQGGMAAPAPHPVIQAVVFPGGAELLRVVPVAAGAGEVVLNCLPARLEVDTLQATPSAASSGLVVGDLRVETLSPEHATGCSANAPLDARIAALEEQRALLQADRDALDLALTYLRKAEPSEGKAVAADGVEALRRQGAQALKAQAKFKQALDALERELAPLQAQREQERKRVPSWLRVTVRVAASQAGQLELRYQTRFASWQPQYRADLRTQQNQLRLERLAEVKQATGEAWDGVTLTLSTRQPQRATGLRPVQPWTLVKAEPVESPPPPMYDTRPAPAPMAIAPRSLEKLSVTGSRVAEETFTPLRVDSDVDAQFTVPGRVSLAGDSELRSFSLETLSWPAQVRAHVQPAHGAQAYTLALFKRPEGFFPRGALQLMRDGQWVGKSQWVVTDETEQSQFFGPEDRVRVRIEPERRDAGEKGFIGSRRVATLGRAWVLENLAGKPLDVQLVEASPHPQHQDIEVQRQFNPPPTELRWRELDGVVLWRATLAPKQSQRFTADYQISAPKDLRVTGWP